MKKNYVYIILVILLLLTISIFNNTDNKTFNVDGINYAVSVDGVSDDSFPDKGAYDVTIDCLNAEGIWNYDEWVIEIYNVSENANCKISFVSKTKVYLNSYIKENLTGKTQGTGQVVNENGYRYEGENPNNYIMFNNELWRIIGVFDETSHGQNGEYLTKIIKKDSLGGFAWDKNGGNTWGTSSLYNLLNTYYYNATDGTTSQHCYHYGTSIQGICNYTVGGIKSLYRSMIKNVIWYLGGSSSANLNTNTIYTNERASGTSTGYIGLMYLSDFGYSVLSSSCDRNTTLSYDFGTTSCGGSSWIVKEADEWTITPTTSSSVFTLSLGFASTGTVGACAVRPTLYLDSSVYIITGDGSITNPYIISM